MRQVLRRNDPRYLALASAFVLVVTALSLAFSAAAASPESRELIRQGVEALPGGKYEEALKHFDAATRADPADAEAVFFQGVALNRLGRHSAAFAGLKLAQAMGYTHPELAFELGWSLIGVGQWDEAIAEMERYEQASPGRGQTSEFLGRAYLGRREWEKAEAKFQEALQRDPALKPTVLFHLALLERERQNLAAAQRQLERLLETAPESPLARLLREQLARLAPPVEKPWRITVSASGGYNSNVIALGDAVPLPSDISSKRSGFARFTLDATYDWRLTPRDTVTAGYGFLGDVYEKVSSSDLRDHFFWVNWRHALTANLAGALRLSDGFTEVGGNAFRNQVSLRPALGWRFADWAVAELTFSSTLSDYFFTAPSVQDRDSTAHTVALTGYATIPGTRAQARLGYFRVWNRADGADFDSKTNGLFVGLSHPLPWETFGEVYYRRTFDRYDNANSLAGPAGFGFRRKDDTDALTVQLSRPIVDRLRAYVRYDFVNADSNISFFTYRQNTLSFGLVASF